MACPPRMDDLARHELAQRRDLARELEEVVAVGGVEELVPVEDHLVDLLQRRGRTKMFAGNPVGRFPGKPSPR